MSIRFYLRRHIALLVLPILLASHTCAAPPGASVSSADTRSEGRAAIEWSSSATVSEIPYILHPGTLYGLQQSEVEHRVTLIFERWDDDEAVSSRPTKSYAVSVSRRSGVGTVALDVSAERSLSHGMSIRIGAMQMLIESTSAPIAGRNTLAETTSATQPSARLDLSLGWEGVQDPLSAAVEWRGIYEGPTSPCTQSLTSSIGVLLNDTTLAGAFVEYVSLAQALVMPSVGAIVRYYMKDDTSLTFRLWSTLVGPRTTGLVISLRHDLR